MGNSEDIIASKKTAICTCGHTNRDDGLCDGSHNLIKDDE